MLVTFNSEGFNHFEKESKLFFRKMSLFDFFDYISQY